MMPMEVLKLGLKLHMAAEIFNFTISGIVLICETTSLLVRKCHDFHGSKSEKYFVQRFCASSKSTSFPLLYPEGAMFPSIFG